MLPSDDFDARHKTDTGGILRLETLTIDSPNAKFGQSYQATPQSALPETIAFIGANPNDFSFIDLGCGKGRMLLAAAELGFAAIVGVEFAPELAHIANANIAIAGARNAAALKLDAADYQFPKGNLVVFMYNPFLAPVLHKVMCNLQRQRSGDVYLIYRYPKCGEVLKDFPYLRYVGSPPGWEGERGIHVWTSVAHGRQRNVQGYLDE
jgi:SAM-dependent methyltransferase